MRRGWHTGKKAGVVSDEEIKCTKSGRSIIWRHSVSSDMIQLRKVCVDKVEKVRRRLCMSGCTLGMYRVKLIME